MLYRPLSKLEPELAAHFKTLRAAAPEAAAAVANKMMTDHMVPGIGNKLAWEDFLTRPRGGVHVILDGNDFGSINKRFGHAEGDKAIVAMGNAIAAARKQYRGKMFRVGGDEFRLHFEKPEQAHGFIRTMRQNLEALPPVQGVHFHSVSVGLGGTPDEADQALLHAKAKKATSNYVPGHAQTHVHSLLGGKSEAVTEPTPEPTPQPVPVAKSASDVLTMMKQENAFRQELAKMALIHDNKRKPTYVYRIENDRGEGPYTSGVAWELPDSRVMNDASTVPDPRMDFEDYERDGAGLNGWSGKPRFGFLTPQDLETWWGAENIAALRSKGFYARKIPAAKVWLSKTKKQVMFHPAEMKGKPTHPRQIALDEFPGAPPGFTPPKKVY